MIISKTINFVVKAHKGQFRKYTKEPFIVHPFSVAGLVSNSTFNIDMICASLLHDIIEDTDNDIEIITKVFGDVISSMVFGMTDPTNLKDGNRKERKLIYKNHLQSQSNEVKTIKLADIIDNSKSIIYFDPNFAKTYLKENIELLSVLKDGDETLYNIADSIINNYFNNLEKKD